MTFQRIGIIGLGLIGGSFAGLIARIYPGATLFGCDLDVQSLEIAQKNGWISTGVTAISQLPTELDLAIVCVPIAQVVGVIEAVSAHVTSDLVITDVASIKGAIVPNGLRANHVYIGAHPMAGSEQSGIGFATDTLLSGATCMLMSSSHPAFLVVKSWFLGLSFHVLEMTPDVHDYWAAYASHVPYLMAALTVKVTESLPNSPFDAIISTGFRDTTRVAAKDPRWGRDVCLYNRDHILPILTNVSTVLQEICELIREKNPKNIHAFFLNVQKIRKTYYE